MDKARLIWFFGASAAGKETLARRVASDAGDPLCEYLGLDGPVQVVEESLDKEVARFRLVDLIIRRLPSSGEALLIKGQSADIWDDREPILCLPEQLRRMLPDSTQEVVFVWADPSECARRCENRLERDRERSHAEGVEFWGRYSPEVCAEELGLHRRWVEALGLPIVWVRNENNRTDIGVPPP
jgi:hypothetical protein